MADPVSLALGIAPLCLSAISGAKLARKKLRLLRHYDKEMCRLGKRLKTQILIFLGESQLLLQEVSDDATVEDKLEDPSPERDAINVVLKKSKLDQAIEDLGESVNDLRRLRKMAKAVQECKSRRPLQKKVMPWPYVLVNQYSTSFHDALIRKWSCLKPDGVHCRHTAKLLDTDVLDEHIDLRLIFEYEAVSGPLQQKYVSSFKISRRVLNS
ncbi:hypothetical protein ACHAPT_011900 [Fusarium lateritium]